jgi:hypothetical protein
LTFFLPHKSWRAKHKSHLHSFLISHDIRHWFAVLKTYHSFLWWDVEIHVSQLPYNWCYCVEIITCAVFTTINLYSSLQVMWQNHSGSFKATPCIWD